MFAWIYPVQRPRILHRVQLFKLVFIHFWEIILQLNLDYTADKQVEYKLVEAENGELMCARDPSTGEPIKSPRCVVKIF